MQATWHQNVHLACDYVPGHARRWPLCLLQVTQTYSPVTARADHSLLQYGFVEQYEEPLLAGVDSATRLDFEDDSWYGE